MDEAERARVQADVALIGSTLRIAADKLAFDEMTGTVLRPENEPTVFRVDQDRRVFLAEEDREIDITRFVDLYDATRGRR